MSANAGSSVRTASTLAAIGTINPALAQLAMSSWPVQMISGARWESAAIRNFLL